MTAFVVAAAMAGSVPGNAVADTGGTPSEVATLPAPTLPGYSPDLPFVAGTSGFLHLQQGLDGYVWTDYASGTDTVQTHLAAVPSNSQFFSAGDHVAHTNGTTLSVGDPAAGTPWIDYKLVPSVAQSSVGVYALGADGTRALVQDNAGVHVLQLNSDGTTAEVPINGLPTAPGSVSQVASSIGSGGVVVLRTFPPSGTVAPLTYSVLRLDTATAVPAPTAWSFNSGARVSGGYLLWSSNGIHALKVDDLFAGTAGTPVTVPIPAGVTSLLDYAAVGQQLLLLSRSGSSAPASLSAAPLSGGPAVPVLPVVTQLRGSWNRSILRQGSDGAVLAVGGVTGSSQAVQRFSAATDGSLVSTAVRQLPPLVERTATLAMVGGRLRQIFTTPQLGTSTLLAAAATTVTGAGTGVGPTSVGLIYHYDHGTLVQAGPCAPDAACVRETDGNAVGPVYETTTGNSATVYDQSASVSFGSADTRVVDTDATFVLIDSNGAQQLWNPASSTSIPLGAANGADVWMGTLWRATGPGTISAYRPAPNATSLPAAQRTVSTGVSCTPDEVQVAQHWLYWSCGAAGRAGVYDLATDVGFSVDPGPALLGDGYLVRHDAMTGELRTTDVHADAVGATTVLATFPEATGATDDRHVAWTVDRQSGAVAYADAALSVHVLTTGLPASPTTVAGNASGLAVPSEEVQSWRFDFEASHPLSGWQLVIRRAATGQLVQTVTGGPVAVTGTASWDGRTPAGLAAYDGTYSWQLLVTPASGTGAGAAPSPAASGRLAVELGRQAFHSYWYDGSPTLVGVLARPAYGQSAGTAMLYQGGGSGLLNNRYVNQGHRFYLGSGPNQLNAVLAFGDFNGDGINDFMARTGAGVLEYWANTSVGMAVNGGTPKVISSGWNSYTSLTAVGDLNGDGHDDLLARDRSGRLWLFPGTGHGTFGAPVSQGGGWNAYTKIVGVGDLNGDGDGDLIAVDTAGVLWRYLSNGKGGLSPRVKIGWGFQAYNSIVGIGEIIAGAPNSFVARDAAGALWRYDFTSAGTLKARARIPGQWNVFSALY